ncbi:small GTP-binding protein [Tritrichomonas foetus]|uniref:Small GTP-binding protein n=1 Tax=Tritrichomonas foetus TaxID=1144522 RepID=A0A1J4L149_9EUKA|nr:small GTP-binding protein [Tritrichomonas foetus]|eukprot:OHT15605.1 small GTP-binding protein [Tritrichomonas foetus]
MQNENEIAPFRIVTIGDGSVGKTSIIVRLVENRFNAYEAATIGANFQTYIQIVEGIKIEMQIWDTAGQEKFKSLNTAYYRNAAAAIAVFSLTSRDTFTNLSKEIETFYSVAGPNAIVFASANKSDLSDEFEVQIKEAKEWAKTRGFHLYFTSAKTGDNIPLLFNDLSLELYKIYQSKFTASFQQNKSLVPIAEVKKGCC